MPQRFTREQISKLVADARAAADLAAQQHNDGLLNSIEKWVWWCELRGRAGFQDLVRGDAYDKLKW